MLSAGMVIPTVFLILAACLTLPAASRPVTLKTTDGNDQCMYTIYVQTGTEDYADTHSVISLTLADNATGVAFRIANLVAWGGIMGNGYDYFQLGRLDIFSGRGPCLPTTPCWMELYSDNSGAQPGWYCNYVQVAMMGPRASCGQTTFTVDQWLFKGEGYEQTAQRDMCGSSSLAVPKKMQAALAAGSSQLKPM